MSNPELFSKRAVILAVILMMTIFSPGNAAQLSALSQLHREVVERLSSLLLDSDCVDESITLIRTLTNTYAEDELLAKVSSHGKNLISMLNKRGNTTEAIQWDQKIGRALNAVSPRMWQSNTTLVEEAKAPTVLKPALKTALKSKSKVKLKTVPKFELTAKPKDEKNPEAKSKLKVVPEFELAAKPESETKSKPKAKLKTVPYVESAAKPKDETKPETKSRLKSALNSERKYGAELKSELKSEIKAELKEESELKAESELNAQSKLNVESGLKAEQKFKPRPEEKSEAWVTDKMGFPLSKPLFEPSFSMPKRNIAKTRSNGVFISQESSNRLKDLKSTIVNLNFKDANIADIVLMLAESGGFNIVSRNEIKGKTTITFNNIPVGTALDLILRTNNYTYQVREDVIWIFKRGEEPISTKVFFVRNINVDELLPTIKRALGQEVGDTNGSQNEQFGHSLGTGANIGPSVNTGESQESNTTSESVTSGSDKVQLSTGWSVYSDIPSNSLIVTASLVKLEEMARLLAVLDVGSVDYKLEERVFTLKYISRDTFIKTIKMTLPKFDDAKQIIDLKRN